MLNTPARIDIIEAMGHLERADAEFLRDAATFYRAVDHALRFYSGHSGASLPNSESQLDVLTELVGRWTPEHLNSQPLKTELSKSRTYPRDFRPALLELRSAQRGTRSPSDENKPGPAASCAMFTEHHRYFGRCISKRSVVACKPHRPCARWAEVWRDRF